MLCISTSRRNPLSRSHMFRSNAKSNAKPKKHRIVNTIEELDLLEPEWKTLHTSFETPLLSYEWFRCAAETFSGPEDLEIHVIETAQTLTAIAPLYKKDHLPVRSELIGSSVLREPGGFLYNSVSDLKMLIESLFETGNGFFLKGLPLEEAESVLLLDLAKHHGMNVHQSIENIPRVRIQKAWEEYEKEQLSGSRRSSFRRLHKKAFQKTGHPLTIEILKATPQSFDSLFLDFLEIESESWKGRTQTALLHHATAHHFFRRYAKMRLTDGEILFFFLRAGDERIAAQFTEVYADKLWIYKIGHREDWQFCSPGVLLMNEVVKYSFKRDFNSCEFLGSYESWLDIWSNSMDVRLTCWIYPDSWSGKIARVKDLSREVWHRTSNVADEWLHR